MFCMVRPGPCPRNNLVGLYCHGTFCISFLLGKFLDGSIILKSRTGHVITLTKGEYEFEGVVVDVLEKLVSAAM